MKDNAINMSDIRTPRDLSFDYLKGVLIFLVVLGHVVTYIPFPTVSDNWLFIFIYSFHMPLFVFVSGFFFASEKNTKLSLLVSKKARRLLLPHFSYSVILLLTVFFFHPFFNEVLYNGTTLSHFKVYHVVLTGLWFLWCIFFCSVITNFIFNYFPKPWAVYGILCALMLCFYDYMPYKVFKDLQLIIQMPFFLLGMYYKENREWVNKYAKIILPVACIGYLLLYGDYENESPYYAVARAVFSIPLFFIIIKQMYKYNILIPVFCFLGNVSLGIYVFHLLLMVLSKNNVLYDFKIDTGTYGQDYLVSLTVSIAVCCFICWLVILLRKNRYLKFIFLGER